MGTVQCQGQTPVFHFNNLDDFREKVGEKGGEKGGEKLTRNQQAIIQGITDNPNISARELAEIVGITSKKTKKISKS